MNVFRLPLSDELIKAVILNPRATFDDMYAIYRSMCNSPKYGKDHELTIKIMKIIKHYVATRPV